MDLNERTAGPHRRRSAFWSPPLFATLASLALGGCLGPDKPTLSVQEAPAPDLLGAKDIDPAMIERITRAAGKGGEGSTDSEAAFRETLKNKPGDIDASIGLAQSLLAQQRMHDALVVLDEALAGAPGNLRLLNAKGVILDKEGRHADAQSLYRLALAGEPKNQMVRNNLGLSLALGGQPDAAIAILRPLAREPGASPQYRESLATALGKKREAGT
jgi:Flp pilus assembly protein TadD